MVAALVRGLEKHSGRLLLRTHVEQVLVENGRAAGGGVGWEGLGVRMGGGCGGL